MSWKIGQYAFDMHLSLKVAELVKESAKNTVSKLLDKVPFNFSEIIHYALHPGGKSILKAIESSLNISKEQNTHAYKILKNYGNMSSATILFVLKKLLEEDKQIKASFIHGFWSWIDHGNNDAKSEVKESLVVNFPYSPIIL